MPNEPLAGIPEQIVGGLIKAIFDVFLKSWIIYWLACAIGLFVLVVGGWYVGVSLYGVWVLSKQSKTPSQ